MDIEFSNLINCSYVTCVLNLYTVILPYSDKTQKRMMTFTQKRVFFAEFSDFFSRSLNINDVLEKCELELFF